MQWRLYRISPLLSENLFMILPIILNNLGEIHSIQKRIIFARL